VAQVSIISVAAVEPRSWWCRLLDRLTGRPAMGSTTAAPEVPPEPEGHWLERLDSDQRATARAHEGVAQRNAHPG
jgi:hypothetical protein